MCIRDSFYTHTLINGKAYFSYYIPLRNQDGSVVGMLFVGRPSETVSLSIQNYVYPLTWLIIGFVALVSVCIYFYTRRFVAVLLHIHSFLSEVASGNLNATLDHSVTCLLYTSYSPVPLRDWTAGFRSEGSREQS